MWIIETRFASTSPFSSNANQAIKTPIEHPNIRPKSSISEAKCLPRLVRASLGFFRQRQQAPVGHGVFDANELDHKKNRAALACTTLEEAPQRTYPLATERGSRKAGRMRCG